MCKRYIFLMILLRGVAISAVLNDTFFIERGEIFNDIFFIMIIVVS